MVVEKAPSRGGGRKGSYECSLKRRLKRTVPVPVNFKQNPAYFHNPAYFQQQISSLSLYKLISDKERNQNHNIRQKLPKTLIFQNFQKWVKISKI